MFFFIKIHEIFTLFCNFKDEWNKILDPPPSFSVIRPVANRRHSLSLPGVQSQVVMVRDMWPGSTRPKKCVRMPHSSQETKGRYLNGIQFTWKSGKTEGHVLPHAGLRRLGARERQLPDASEVGSGDTAAGLNNASCLGFAVQTDVIHLQGEWFSVLILKPLFLGNVRLNSVQNLQLTSLCFILKIKTVRVWFAQIKWPKQLSSYHQIWIQI